jgi:hypothetical protein
MKQYKVEIRTSHKPLGFLIPPVGSRVKVTRLLTRIDIIKTIGAGAVVKVLNTNKTISSINEVTQILMDSDKVDDVPVTIVADKVEVKASVKSEKVEAKEAVEEKVEDKEAVEEKVEAKASFKKEDTKSKK